MKKTKQRKEILDVLSSTKSHPNAYEVFDEVRKRVNGISLATVYRNLNGMVAEGKARRVTDANSVEHFDYDTSEHCHFLCRKCGKIFDVETRGAPKVCEAGYRVEFSDVRFYGLCLKCNAETQE